MRKRKKEKKGERREWEKIERGNIRPRNAMAPRVNYLNPYSTSFKNTRKRKPCPETIPRGEVSAHGWQVSHCDVFLVISFLSHA